MSSIKDGRIYGYELAEKIQELSGGHLIVSYGVIYPFLRRMEQSQVVRSRRDESAGRVYYELTRKGKLAVQELPQRLKETQEEASEQLLGEMLVYSRLYGYKALKRLCMLRPRRLDIASQVWICGSLRFSSGCDASMPGNPHTEPLYSEENQSEGQHIHDKQ
jgi:DNA-binding PadR family transcriptional regulator